MIHRFGFVVALITAGLLADVRLAVADDPVFSGPQVGERLAPFVSRGVLGEAAGEDFDLVSIADGSPLLIIFVHEVTRPSIGLTRAVIDYARKQEKEGLQSGVVFLTGDPTSTEAFLKRAAHAMPRGVPLGISMDGQEGPGAYGLNRNVALTVLVAKENRVTANFALRQPSLPQDVPEIGHALVKVLGGDRKPTLAEMGVRPGAMMRERAAGSSVAADERSDERFRALLRPVIRRDATPDEVHEAAEKVESHAAENEAFRKRVADAARRIVDSGRLETYGTSVAQDYLKKWAEEFSKESDEEPAEKDETDSNE